MKDTRNPARSVAGTIPCDGVDMGRPGGRHKPRFPHARHAFAEGIGAAGGVAVLGLATRAVVCLRASRTEEAVAMRVIGIDPGLRRTGWGVVDAEGGRLRHLGNGVCVSEGGSLAARLCSLHAQLAAVVARYLPDAAAVEQTFVNRDGAGTLKLGQARGIALLVPAQAGLEVAEYAPNAVKKVVVGVGHADKVQVAHMVQLQLPGVEFAGPDASDALAIALCHAHHLAFGGRLQAAIAGVRA